MDTTALPTQISFIAAVVNVTMAAMVLLNGPRRHLNQAFSLLAFSLFGWNFGNVLAQVSPWTGAQQFASICLTFVPVTGYHFVLAFVGRYRKTGWIIVKIAYGVAAVAGILVYCFPWMLDFWFPLFCYLTFPLLFYLSLYRLNRRIHESFSNLEKAQIGYIFGGAILALVLGFTDVLAQWGLTTYSLANLGSFIFTLLIAVVIVRFGFLDLGVVVGRALLIIILSTFIYIFYRVAGSIFGETTFALFFNVVLATLFLIMVFEPLRRLMESLADRFVQRDSLTFQERLARLSKDIISIVDLDELFEHTYGVLSQSGRIRAVSIFVLDSEQKVYRQVQPPPRDSRRALVEADKAVITYLKRWPRILVREELQRDLNQTWLSADARKNYLAVQRTLNWQGMEICVPFFYRGRLRAFLFMTLQEHQPLLNRRERDLLLALGGQLAISLENARIFRRMSEKDRLAALGEMAAGLAHEIRNPLGAIKGAAQFISSDIHDPAQREFLDIILQETDRLNQVLGRFLVFAKPSQKRLEQHSLRRLFERVVPLVRPVTDVPWEVNLNIPEEMPEVFIDGEELQQVFLNLLINARDAMPQGGEVTIDVSFPEVEAEEGDDPPEADGDLVIQIRDSGVGIAQENLKKVFTPFFTTREDGTGLGLAISQRIIEDLGGRIEVESIPDVGTTFTIHLPFRPVVREPEPVEEPSP